MLFRVPGIQINSIVSRRLMQEFDMSCFYYPNEPAPYVQ